MYHLCLSISKGVGKGERKRELFMNVGGGGYEVSVLGCV